ncbi:TerC family protein [Aneurinibacillus aneurinilyticus]|jgi:YjbE family integral membrane protein|uniref:TerC family protein n=3 Tax=Bacillales TaxID=1385 RepID=A0A848CPU9_ANEAE|nr:TerC family protein [Aneurinibacillus aneurinilyticus]ERI08809.1 integral membrane protein, YjbE family [Aneurinibacillus aneurinilyticus ATCC 12856]MCI1695040.1 TerC family protein [Aneurinibacillus aneurinilyticus]MED0706649.1 TerC family protein [Aneurinibacillus aneurinilyticus]MED0723588.1 TerC family protein [Aneurinibacillus aneurinilyticus]MED0731710.1 TerC family protein [Aneurinibacillus aneurinilyticus]
MELFSAEFFSALLAILVIDLVLAGDNAIVIGLAARRLPKEQQKKVIIWGTVGAIFIRILATLVVVWLLNIPGLLLLGGLLLIWIAYKLLVKEKNHDDIKAEKSLWNAVRTIIIADAAMGLDNVLAVAGAAHGSFLLVVLGLLISVPVVVWGSTLIISWIERFPSLIYIGAGVLVWTAAKMIVDEPFIADYFDVNPVLKWSFTIVLIAGVLLAGRQKKQRKTVTNS